MGTSASGNEVTPTLLFSGVSILLPEGVFPDWTGLSEVGAERKDDAVVAA